MSAYSSERTAFTTRMPVVLTALALTMLTACQDKTATDATAASKANASGGVSASTGEALYKTHCAACHQASGAGLAGAFPPLARSDYLLADRDRAIATVLSGLSGEITVNGVKYNSVMPGVGHLSDSDLSAILTYVFSAWGNDGAPVSEADIAAARNTLGASDRAQGERHAGASEGEMRASL